MAANWAPESWRTHEARQLPDYPDQQALAAAEHELSGYPPLVFAGEARDAEATISAEVAAGRGVPAPGRRLRRELRRIPSRTTIRDTFRVILQMAVILTYSSKLPIVKVGRMAGQFAKPRSAATEEQDGVSLPSYRGDNVNDIAFTPAGRAARSAAHDESAYNAVGGDAQPAARLRHRAAMPISSRSTAWTLDFMGRSPWAERNTSQLADPHRRGARLHGGVRRQPVDRAAAPGRPASTPATRRCCCRIEQALTRQDSASPANGTTVQRAHGVDRRSHALRRLGARRVSPRRRQSDRAQMRAEPRRRTRSCACSTSLDPAREPGRITLITRYGHDKIEAGLPKLVRAVKREGRPVVWSLRSDARQRRQGRRTATRLARSTASSPRCAASSRCIAPRAPTAAASTPR